MEIQPPFANHDIRNSWHSFLKDTSLNSAQKNKLSSLRVWFFKRFFLTKDVFFKSQSCCGFLFNKKLHFRLRVVSRKEVLPGCLASPMPSISTLAQARCFPEPHSGMPGALQGHTRERPVPSRTTLMLAKCLPEQHWGNSKAFQSELALVWPWKALGLHQCGAGRHWACLVANSAWLHQSALPPPLAGASHALVAMKASSVPSSTTLGQAQCLPGPHKGKLTLHTKGKKMKCNVDQCLPSPH